MTHQGFGILAVIGGATLLLSLSGCYTQLGSFRDRHDPEYTSDGTQESEEYADTVNEEEYADARQRFYDESYYPYIGIGYDYNSGWGGPMYGHGYPWYGYPGYGYPWYSDPFFGVYAGFTPWYMYPRHTYGGGGNSAGRGRPNATRTIGTHRTYGTTSGVIDNGRTVPAYVPLPVGVRSDKTPAGTPVPARGQPGVTTGRRGAAGERRAPAAAVPPADKTGTTQGGARPAPETPAPDSGRRSSGGSRTTERPVTTPPPSPPPSSQPAPSGGNRGGETRGGGESSGSRGGTRR